MDYFFRRYAGQNQFRHHIGVTYIATDEDTIFGYMTIAMGSIEAPELPDIKGLPRQYSLPILRLGRLAVDFLYQNRGIGKQLLRYAIQLAIHQIDTMGCIGIVVDAKTESIGFYKKFGFQPIDDTVEGLMRVHPSPLPMFLSLRTCS